MIRLIALLFVSLLLVTSGKEERQRLAAVAEEHRRTARDRAVLGSFVA